MSLPIGGLLGKRLMNDGPFILNFEQHEVTWVLSVLGLILTPK